MPRHFCVSEETHTNTYRSQSTTFDIVCQELNTFIWDSVPSWPGALWLGQFGCSLISRDLCVSRPALGLQAHTDGSSVFVYVVSENKIQVLMHITKVLCWLNHLASPEKMSRLHGVLISISHVIGTYMAKGHYESRFTLQYPRALVLGCQNLQLPSLL